MDFKHKLAISRTDLDIASKALLAEYSQLLEDTTADERERERLTKIVAALFELLNRKVFGPRRNGKETVIQLD